MTQTSMKKRENGEVVRREDSRDVTLTPRVDIVETEEEVLLFVDLPGVHPENVEVRFENGELTLNGRRTAKNLGRPWLWEFEAGGFHRQFRVAENISGDKIHAEMKNGVMTVHLPKVEAVKPRKIAIKAD